MSLLKHGRKLTDDQIREIRAVDRVYPCGVDLYPLPPGRPEWANRGMSEIGRHYGVHHTTIEKALGRHTLKTYRDVK